MQSGQKSPTAPLCAPRLSAGERDETACQILFPSIFSFNFADLDPRAPPIKGVERINPKRINTANPVYFPILFQGCEYLEKNLWRSCVSIFDLWKKKLWCFQIRAIILFSGEDLLGNKTYYCYPGLGQPSWEACYRSQRVGHFFGGEFHPQKFYP